MNKPLRIVILLLVLAAIGGGAWWYLHRPADNDSLTLYGNVDLRQASFAFNGSERIAGVLVEEGDIVKKGQVLARLDTNRLAPQVREADATVAAQRAM
ncbi:MAG TPA: biotin/lipoyl-binding protein, partial [Phyllobacterium sp.]|nr:biotin/lipoyl-binding protein [Phyllobacterium sp.]